MSHKGRKIRKYDEEFKRRAVELSITTGKSYEKLSEELGIPANTLYGWAKSPQYAPSQKALAGQAAVESNVMKEIKALKRELSIIKEERDILKKALAIFSGDVPKN
jgi:transposase